MIPVIVSLGWLNCSRKYRFCNRPLSTPGHRLATVCVDDVVVTHPGHIQRIRKQTDNNHRWQHAKACLVQRACPYFELSTEMLEKS
jgi:hypothetical protein